MDDNCSCDTGKPFAECCQPVISGEKPAQTALELMRARYTSYVRGEVDFIMNSILPAKQGDYDKKGIESWSKNTDWAGLEVVNTSEGGPQDNSGTVEFIAYFREKDATKKHHESASFKKKDDKWFFEDGKKAAVQQVVRESPKIGRNDPCHCGSGKKYKKCHGAA